MEIVARAVLLLVLLLLVVVMWIVLRDQDRKTERMAFSLGCQMRGVEKQLCDAAAVKWQDGRR